MDENGTVKAKGTKTKTTTPPKSRMAEEISKKAAPQPQTGGGDTETITITE